MEKLRKCIVLFSIFVLGCSSKEFEREYHIVKVGQQYDTTLLTYFNKKGVPDSSINYWSNGAYKINKYNSEGRVIKSSSFDAEGNLLGVTSYEEYLGLSDSMKQYFIIHDDDTQSIVKRYESAKDGSTTEIMIDWVTKIPLSKSIIINLNADIPKIPQITVDKKYRYIEKTINILIDGKKVKSFYLNSDSLKIIQDYSYEKDLIIGYESLITSKSGVQTKEKVLISRE